MDEGTGIASSLLSRTFLFLVLGCVVVLLVVGYMWMRARKEKFESNGTTNLDTIFNLVTGENPNDPQGGEYVFNDTAVESTQRETIPSRTCAIYYTNNIELCDDTVNNWYIRPMNEIRRYRDQLQALPKRSPTQDAQLDAANKVIADRESGNLPKGICKVEFPGWIEPKVTASGEPFPYKNKAAFENTNRLYPDDWAFCFKSADSIESAIAQSKSFADEYVVKSFDYAGDYFQDGKVYSKIAFTTINLADNLPSGAVARAPRATSINSFVCATQPPPIPNVPSTMLIFELSNDVLRSMYIGRYNQDTSTFEQIDDSEIIFQGLFETRQSGRSLYLVPKMLNGSIYQFAFDVCGRMSGNSSASTEFTLSLVRDLGIQPRLLYTAPSTTSPTFGTLEELKERVANIGSEIDKVNAEIAQVNALTSTPQYAQGHVRYTYKLNMNNPPNMANASALDIIFDGTDPSTDSPNAILESRQIVKTSPSERTYMNDGSRIKYGYIIEGYINIGGLPGGRYSFNINSDDAGDFMIENTVVASHYNYHIMNDRGVKGDFRLDRNKYYKFRARLAQWDSGSGIALQWRMGMQKIYTDIPADVFYYDENDTKRYEANLRKKALASTISNKALVEQTIDQIEKRRNQFMGLAFQNIANRRLTKWKDYVSVDGRLYVDIGSLDGTIGRSDEQALGQVILQEQATSITGGIKEFPSPVSRFDDGVQYSISFWIYIGQTFPRWINIFYHGIHDNWNLIKDGDRTPGIWLHPNSTRIHFRQRSSAWGNDGCDTSDGLPMNRWTHFVAVVNGTSTAVFDQPSQSIQLYVNGQKLKPAAGATNFKQLVNNAVWHWGQQVGKKARIGFNGNVATGKGVFVQKVHWYNRILSAEEVSDIYNNSGILRNRRSECRNVESATGDAYGWKTSSIANMNLECNKDEALSSVALVALDGDQAKYNFRCCRVQSDDLLKVTAEDTNTSYSLYKDGNVSMLTEHNVDCQSKSLQQMNLVTVPDRDFAYYKYRCADHSSTVNMNVKCTPKSTQWVNDDETMKPLSSLEVKCDDHEHLSRMQVVRDVANKKIKYDYSCCEVGGL